MPRLLYGWAYVGPELMVGAGVIVLLSVAAASFAAWLPGRKSNKPDRQSESVDLDRREKQMAALISNLAAVLKVMDLDGILHWTARTARELVDAPYAHAALLRGSRHGTSAEAGLDAYPTWWHPKIQRLVLWSSNTREVLRDEEVLGGIEGLVAIPVVSPDGQGMGALIVGGRDISDQEEHTLKQVAAQAGQALDLAERNAPGGRDPVSGLPGEASLTRVLDREFSQNNTMTLFVAKPCRPQDYNRVYGPGAWDALLGRISLDLEEKFRWVFRQGDGLAVLKRGGARTRQTVLRLRQTIAALTSDFAAPIEVAVGFVTVTPEEAGGPNTLLLEAASEAATEAATRPENIFGGPIADLTETLRDRKPRVQEEQTVLTLIKAAEIRDPYLGFHMKDVSQLSMSIGYQMSLPETEIDLLAVGALLHDIGKIGIPDSILRKPGRLTREEYEIIRSHPELGARILAEAGLSAAIPAVKHHHERFDGGGYPDGLAGEDIPLLARIVCVADAFSTMIHDKPYRQKIARNVALEEILHNSGTQFDPDIATALAEVLRDTDEQPVSNTS